MYTPVNPSFTIKKWGLRGQDYIGMVSWCNLIWTISVRTELAYWSSFGVKTALKGIKIEKNKSYRELDKESNDIKNRRISTRGWGRRVFSNLFCLFSAASDPGLLCLPRSLICDDRHDPAGT